MWPKNPNVVYFECSHQCDHSEPDSGFFGENLGTLQTHSKFSQFSSFHEMCLQCSQIFPKKSRVWFTMVTLMGTFKIYHIGIFWSHHSGSFWILLAGNTVIKPVGTLQKILQIIQLGTSLLLSLGKLKMYPAITYLGHPGHMTWNTVNVPAVSCQWATRLYCGIFLGKIQNVPINYIIRTLQSHHWGNCECTECFLDQGNCKEISLENCECTFSAQLSI